MTNNIVQTLSNMKNLLFTKGVAIDEILSAEKQLHIKFAAEFTEYLQTYGCMAFGEHEFMGLGSSKRLNIVTNTLLERRRLQKVMDDKYVLELIEDGYMTVAQDANGVVYEILANGEIQKTYANLNDYIVFLTN